ncbi:MAG: phosphopantetheine-binding protein [Candidatus Omnitrophota bacterium]
MPVNIEEEIKQMLSRLTGLEPEEISMEIDVIDDLGIDSLKFIEIATELERTFKVVIKNSQLMQLRKVGEAVALVKEILGQDND